MAAAFAAFVVAAPANAVAVANDSYLNRFDVVSTANTFAGAIITTPAGATKIDSSALTAGPDLAVGANSFDTFEPFTGKGYNAGDPFSAVFYGLSYLDDEADPANPLNNLHLTLSLESAYALSIAGVEFDVAFADFLSVADSPLSEQSFINELVYFAGLGDEYGLIQPGEFGSEPGQNPTNLLFEFAQYLDSKGHAPAAGNGVTILAFSQAKTIATGTVTAQIVPSSGAVPEPATWAMMMLGFGVVGAALRRRRATVFA